MQSILVIIIIGLVGGMAVGLQAPMSSMISQRLGVPIVILTHPR